VDWSAHLAVAGTLAVDAALNQSKLTHSRYVEQRVKDAVVDALRTADGLRPGVDTERPDVRLNLYLRRDKAVLSLDLSGEALHRRGWRIAQGAAPMKENLACAVLLRAGWPEVHAQGGALIDPMCGSGTLLIEAARMAADVAPGLDREYFGLFGWKQFDAVLWQGLMDEARERAARGRAALQPVFFGRDADRVAITLARDNAMAAGVSACIDWQVADIRDLQVPKGVTTGLVVSNPPYDERLAADTRLYRELGASLRARFTGWRVALITVEDAMGFSTGLRLEKRYTLYNGAIQCQLMRFLPVPEKAAEPRALALSPGAEMVANRLRKNLRKLKTWRTREQVTCFRAYDADLPEYAAAIDVYDVVDGERPEDRGLWLHVQEYQAPKTIPEEETRRRLGELVQAAMQVFELPRDRVALKTRAPQSRQQRYQKQDSRGHWLWVMEDGLRVRLNLFDYLDTGLFLDHRPIRRALRHYAKGARVLNLFAYTGVATLHMAAGGARQTTTVDLSATYLDWAASNLAANGFSGQSHRLIQADTLRYLAAETQRFELIFCDPPTFSNSAKADDFDVQRHHGELIRACMRRLTPDGLLVFSNNFRRFKLDADIDEDFEVREWPTQASIPVDFERDPKIHRVFDIRHRA
jgi:23S rRNA (guanine2445-N2)-methyltransferase / 23S rRNA (guanine2069-N7)-methyltransferase